MKIWDCKIGQIDGADLPDGADQPMREAVRRAYVELTGEEPAFLFSGWGGSLTKIEREVVDESAARSAGIAPSAAPSQEPDS